MKKTRNALKITGLLLTLVMLVAMPGVFHVTVFAEEIPPAITTQPTADDPTVGVNVTEGTTYQWYQYEPDTSGMTEITDQTEGVTPFTYNNTTTTYSSETGWSSVKNGRYYYFSIALEAGDALFLINEEGTSISFQIRCSDPYGSANTERPNLIHTAKLVAPVSGTYTVDSTDSGKCRAYLIKAAYASYDPAKATLLTTENTEAADGTYDSETNIWSADAGKNHFSVSLNKGDTVIVDLQSSPSSDILFSYLQNENDHGSICGVKSQATLVMTVQETGKYCVSLNQAATIKAYLIPAQPTDSTQKLDGETSAILTNPKNREEYFCEVTFANGSVLYSDWVRFYAKITTQPTNNAPTVEVAPKALIEGYQWYSNDDTALPNETSATLQTTDAGVYYCVVTLKGGSTLTSDTVWYPLVMTHQPTAEEPYVATNAPVGAELDYQWYIVKDSSVEVVDDGVRGNEISYNNYSFYDPATGWNGDWWGNDGADYLYVYLYEGETVIIVPSAYCDEIGIYDCYDGTSGTSDYGYSAGDQFTYVCEYEGWYFVYAYTDYDDGTTLRAYIGDIEYTPIEGATSSTLSETAYGDIVCKVNYGKENATYDSTTDNWTPVCDEYEDFSSFIIDLNVGDTVHYVLSGATDCVGLYDAKNDNAYSNNIDGGNDLPLTGSITVEADGTYVFYTNDDVLVTATVERAVAEGNPIPITDQNADGYVYEGEILISDQFHLCHDNGYGYCEFCQVEIDGASITVGQDLTMNYSVNIMDEELLASLANISMRFTMNGKSVVVNLDETKTDEDGYYVFSFEGIAPQCMSDHIKAELLNGETVIASKDEYSVKANAEALLKEYSTDQALVQFVTDILAYGAAAQNYKDHNLENLANKDLSTELAPSEVLPTKSDKSITASESETVYFTSATVWFDNVNKIGVKLSTIENVTLKVNDETVELTGTTYYTDAIYATGFDTVYTFELYEGDTLVQTLTYSVSSYVYAMMNKTEADGTTPTEMAELAKALYRYGASAVAYQNTKTSES